MGTLHYPPNADGIRWFAKEIFPQIKREIPSVSLTIIGKNPPADFVQMASENPEFIKVTGYVPDLNPYMDQAAIMVVPVRVGGGMRVRILEGFARAMPMVTTTIGLEGIDARLGSDIIVEDTEDAFAKSVVKLFNDPNMQKQLAENGRKLAEDRYDWQAVLETLGSLYADIHNN
jgi:glycosyltransferase involved in cell wall biosynthesis